MGSKVIITFIIIMICGCAKQQTVQFNSEETLKFQCKMSVLRENNNRMSLEDHRVAAEKEGIEICQITLAVRYRQGLGVPVDYTLAKKFYGMTPLGLISLAEMAELGQGEPVNLAKAEYLYREATQKGNTCFRLNLAEFLHKHSRSVEEVSELYSKSLDEACPGTKKSFYTVHQSGFAFPDEAVKKYQLLWFASFRNSVGNRLARYKPLKNRQATLKQDIEVPIVFMFRKSTEMPLLTISTASADENVDNLLIQYFSNKKLYQDFLFCQAQEELEVKWTVNILKTGVQY